MLILEIKGFSNWLSVFNYGFIKDVQGQKTAGLWFISCNYKISQAKRV